MGNGGMRAWWVVALIGAVAACLPSGHGAEPPVAIPVPGAPTGSPARRDLAPLRSGKALLTISIPDNPLCEISNARHGYRAIDLAFAAGARPFATLPETGAMTAYVTRGDPTSGIIVEADAGGLLIRGVTSASSLTFHADRVSLFEGVIIPKGVAPLRLIGAKKEGLRYRLELPDEVRVEARDSVTGTLPCTIAALAPVDFDPFETFLGAPTGAALLVVGKVPLATHADGPPTALLAASGDQEARAVAVLAREGARVKITWELEDIIVFGWVDTRYVQSFAGPPRADFRGGGLGASEPRAVCCARTLVCEGEVPLRVDHDGQSQVVGLISPGARIGFRAELGDAIEIALPDADLVMAPGAKLLVDTRWLTACREQAPP
jgi:hypothetical protein